jgi:hypothetical protein
MNASTQDKKYCAANKNNATATKICKSYGSSVAEWSIFTPDGTQSGDWIYYTM